MWQGQVLISGPEINLPDGVCNRNRSLETMLQQESPDINLPDGVCNPVRNVLSVPGSKCFGRGCKPRPAIGIRSAKIERSGFLQWGCKKPFRSAPHQECKN